MNLDDLFKDTGKAVQYPGCVGCSNLDRNLPVHCFKPIVDKCDILFLVDSYHWSGSTIEPLSPLENVLFDNFIYKLCKGYSYTILPAISCPGVTDNNITASDMKICRKYMHEYVAQAEPKLIFCLGNLSMKMLLSKSGLLDKRGCAFDYNGAVVIPTTHPMTVALEPKNTSLFQQDVKNAVNKYLRKITKDPNLDIVIVDSLGSLDAQLNKINLVSTDISVDIETTGLDFLKDKITTIGISYKNGDKLWQVIIPYEHFESPFSEEDRKIIITKLRPLFLDSRKKILQNALFDLKFLYGQGLEFNNVWDTKLMSHVVNENMPKSLMDLVKQYFPEYLENL